MRSLSRSPTQRETLPLVRPFAEGNFPPLPDFPKANLKISAPPEAAFLPRKSGLLGGLQGARGKSGTNSRGGRKIDLYARTTRAPRARAPTHSSDPPTPAKLQLRRADPGLAAGSSGAGAGRRCGARRSTGGEARALPGVCGERPPLGGGASTEASPGERPQRREV